MLNRERVAADIKDDGAIMHTALRTPRGAVSAEFRVYARFEVDGVEFEVDHCVRLAAKRVKKKQVK